MRNNVLTGKTYNLKSPKHFADSTVIDTYVMRLIARIVTARDANVHRASRARVARDVRCRFWWLQQAYVYVPRIWPRSAASLGGTFQREVLTGPFGERRCGMRRWHVSSMWGPSGPRCTLFSYCVVF